MATKPDKPFQFKQFSILQDQCTMKVGTDGILLGAWADVSGAKTALDIGTGTGLIAIMLAQRTESMIIHAVEIDRSAFLQAQENMKNTPWDARLSAFHVPIQEYANEAKIRYDLIVSNPPFFSGGTFSQHQEKNNVRHTVKLAHGDLLAAVRNLLSEQGRFCLILPYIEGLRFQELAMTYKLFCTKAVEVYPKINKPVERLLLTFERFEKRKQETSLTIQHDKRNDWTEDFHSLTGDFYLDA